MVVTYDSVELLVYLEYNEDLARWELFWGSFFLERM